MLDVVSYAYNDPGRKNSRKPLKWILIDSLIVGGIAMAAAMPNTVPTAADLWVMFKGFLYSFLVQLAIERGVKRAD